MLTDRTGKASKLSLDTSGSVASSGNDISDNAFWTSFSASSISVSKSNSIWTVEAFAKEEELTSSTPSRSCIRCSIGTVTSSATSSGAAPGYVVITDKFGKLILGIISCIIFNPQNTSISITIIIKNQLANLLFKEKSINFFKL